MAKKTKKQSIRPEISNRGGCMPRLISMFNSRHGHLSQRLLSDKKTYASRHSDFQGDGSSSGKLESPAGEEKEHTTPENVDRSADEDFNPCASIKYLIEQEMSEAEQPEEATKDNAEIRAEIRDQPSGLGNKQKTESFSHRLNLAGLLEQYSSNGSTREVAGSEEILNPSSSLVKPKQDKASGKGAELKNSKLLEKWKSIQRPREETLSYKIQQKQRIHRLFRKKQKSRDGEEIVVLTAKRQVTNDSYRTASSETAEGEGRLNSHFSLKEVKRKLKHAIQDYRRDHKVWFLGSILHTIPHRHQNSCDLKQRKSHIEEHETGKLTKLEEKATTSQSRSTSIASTSTAPEKEYEFQREAKRHLATMLSTLNDDEHSQALPSSSRPFGKILSLLGNNSQFPTPYPEREKNSNSLVSLLNLNQEENILSTLEIVEDTASTSMVDEVHEKIFSVDISGPEYFDELLNPDDTPGRDSLDVESKLDVDERREEDISNLSEESEIEILRAPTTPATLPVKDMPSEESITEKPERPSPVSVLDSLFSEGDGSPENHTDKHVDFLGQLRHIQFDEQEESQEFPPVLGHEPDHRTFLNDDNSTAEYVQRVLEASGLMRENRERWHSSTPMLNPSLYDEVEYPSEEFPHDLHLLFDSASEVLEEMREKFMVPITKPNACPFPSEDQLLARVLKGINLNCASHAPDSLEQIMEKDLGMWMNLRPETDSIAAILEEEILENMIKEVVIQLQISAWKSTYFSMKGWSRRSK